MINPFKLRRPISPTTTMNEDDVLSTKKALSSLGHFKVPKYGMTRFPDEPMIAGLKDFQRQNNLRPDGVMNPDGPTHRRLSDVLTERRKPATSGRASIVEGEHDILKRRPDPIIESIERMRRRRIEERRRLTMPRRKEALLPDNATILVPRRQSRSPVFDILGEVGRGRRNSPTDILALRRALAWAGHLNRDKALDRTDADDELFDAVTRFQKTTGVKADGFLKPRGETARALNDDIGPKLREIREREPKDSLGKPFPSRPGADPRPKSDRDGEQVALGPAAAALPFILGQAGRMALQRGAQSLLGGAATAAAGSLKGDTPNNSKRTDMASPPPSTPPSEPQRDQGGKKTEFPAEAPFGPATEIFPRPEEREEMLKGFPDQRDEMLQHIIIENRRGDADTQLDNDYAILAYNDRVKRWKLRGRHFKGGHSPDGTYQPERYIRPKDGTGAAWTDATFAFDEGTDGERFEEIQTVDVLKDGETLDARERRGDKKVRTLKEKHGEKGEVFNLPKSRGRDRKEWEREIDALMDHHFWRRYGAPPAAK